LIKGAEFKARTEIQSRKIEEKILEDMISVTEVELEKCTLWQAEQ
jgi:hypothetical protein